MAETVPSGEGSFPGPPVDRREAFAEAVTGGRVDASRPLPTEHVPLARRLLGDGPLPSVSAGPRTAMALRHAGAQAATVGSTIYLDRSPGSDGRSRAVMAHEMVHVAHGGSTPRFLDDTADDAEEREAAAVEVAVQDSRTGHASTQTTESAAPGEEAEEPLEPRAELDMDTVVERLTDRILLEVERRGGRYGGVF